MDNIQKKHLKKGKATYEIYCGWVDQVNSEGNPVLPFENLGQNFKKAWIMAANGVYREDIVTPSEI